MRSRSLVSVASACLIGCGSPAIVGGSAPPSLASEAWTTDEDVPLAGVIEVTADDPTSVTLSVVREPQLGTLRLVPGVLGAFEYTPDPNANGADGFTVEATDGELTSAPLDVSVTITPVNDAPTLASVAIGPDPARAGDVLVAEPAGPADAEGDPVAYAFAWYVNGAEIVGETGATLQGHFVRGDHVWVAVVPDDGMARGTLVLSRVLIIESHPPSLAAVDLGGPYFHGATVVATPVGASDADGDVPGFWFAWDVNSVPVGGGAGGTLVYAGLVKGDVVAVTVTPWDPADVGAPVTGSITIQNSAPTLASVSIGPGPYYTNDVITASPAGFSDLDGDPAVYAYQWFANAAPIAGATGPTLDGATAFDAGDAVSCRVTPGDGVASGPEVDSNVVVIQ